MSRVWWWWGCYNTAAEPLHTARLSSVTVQRIVDVGFRCHARALMLPSRLRPLVLSKPGMACCSCCCHWLFLLLPLRLPLLLLPHCAGLCCHWLLVCCCLCVCRFLMVMLRLLLRLLVMCCIGRSMLLVVYYLLDEACHRHCWSCHRCLLQRQLILCAIAFRVDCCPPLA